MKKLKLLIVILVLMLVVNVKADMGPPMVATHKVLVTNKNGTQCYEEPSGKKEDRVIPYGTELEVSEDIEGSYILVRFVDETSEDDEYSCYVKYVDVSAKSQNFSMKDESVEKMTATKLVVLAKGGVNLRKGPSVTYSRLTTVPQYTTLTATYSSGEYWYYVTYNGKSGWITGINDYLGFDSKDVLFHYNSVKIYSSDGKKVLGTIPANTEITNYLRLSDFRSGYSYYVSYNNIKGYIEDVGFKTDGVGKIKLTEDYEVEGKQKTKIAKGTVLEYTVIYEDINVEGFYIPAKKIKTEFLYGSGYSVVKEAKLLTKTKGFIGEGLFGEKATKKTDATTKPTEVTEPKEVDEPVDEPVIDEPKTDKENGMSTRDIIIICLLGGIFLALTAIVLIKLVDKKNNKTTSYKEEKKSYNEERKPYHEDRKPYHEDRKPYNDDRRSYDEEKKDYQSEIEDAREAIKKRLNEEKDEKSVKLDDEINNIKDVEDHNDREV